MSNKKHVSSGAEKAESLTRAQSEKQTGENAGAAKKSGKTAQDGAIKEAAEIKALGSNKSAAKSTVKATAKPAAKSATKPAATKTAADGESGKKRSALKHEKSGARGAKTKKNKPAKQISEKKRAALERREEKRRAAAEIRAERKKHRLEKKLEAKQKRLDRIAAFKEKREERKEQRRERRDLLKSETKAQRIQRKKEERAAKLEARVAKREAAATEKRAKREHRLKVKAERRLAHSQRQHAPGFGGWLAAVISLGVTTLALGTILTFGWINMNGVQEDMSGVYTQSLYELNSVVDNLDTNLAKARVSSSSGDRVRVLSDIAIESEMAEVILERMPLDVTMTEQMASFINKMGDAAQSMLFTVADGGELSASQEMSLQYMYETNLKIKQALNELIANSNGSDLMAAMRGKGGIISDGFSDIQNNVIEAPKGIQDGPFSDSLEDTNPSFLNGLEEITSAEAEEIARELFKNYKIKDARCTGEAATSKITVYNVTLSTKDGEMLAQISKKGGKPVMFDSHKDCKDVNFSAERCLTIAEDFLESVGYSGLKAVWTSENGTTCNINFAPEQNGAVLYPDLIKVKVCEERGIVTGMEAISYVLNHGERKVGEASVSKEQAKSAINGSIEVTSSRLAVIPFEGDEVLCYEFAGKSGENEYYVYVDANTGVEIEVLTVIGTKQGRAVL